MIKEILREINNYFKDIQHDKSLTILRKKYGKFFYYAKEDINGHIVYLDIYKHKEGCIWHYIGNGIYSYLSKKKRK